MAPLSSTSNVVAMVTTYTTTYLAVTCTPTSSDYECTSSSTPLTSTGQGYTAIAQYMQATRSTITDGAIGLGPLQMVWRATPYVVYFCLRSSRPRCPTRDSLAIVANWHASIIEAMPTDFEWSEEITLATALPTTDATPDWIAQLSPEVQMFYASVSLPMYTTPVRYYEYYQFVSTRLPQLSQTSVLVGAGGTTASRSNSAAVSTKSTETISAGLASTHQTVSSPTSLSDETGISNANAFDDTTMTPGQKAAIATCVVVMTLAMICGLMIYFGRIRPVRKRRLAEAIPAPGQHSATCDVKALTSSEPNGQHSNVSSWSEKPKTTMPSPAELPAPNLSSSPELEGISTVDTSGRHASYHGSIELQGSSMPTAGGESFMIDAGVHLASQATSDDR